MTKSLVIEDFQGLENSDFIAKTENSDSLAFRLLKVEALPDCRTEAQKEVFRQPFSLIFQGPKHVNFSQSNVGFEHALFGNEAYPIFIVAISEAIDAPDCTCYQAVFN